MLQYGETALHKAALKGHVEVVELLVKYGAAVDIRNKVLHCTYRKHFNDMDTNDIVSMTLCFSHH